MKKLFFLLVPAGVIVFGGLYLSLRDNHPGIKMPDAVPVLAVPEHPASESAQPPLSEPETFTSSATPKPISPARQFTSKDGKVTFAYPAAWYMSNTTQKTGASAQTQVLESFTLTSTKSNSIGGGGIPADSVKIDGQISELAQAQSVRDLTTCQGKPVECSMVTINGRQFKRAVFGVPGDTQTVVYETVHDTILFSMSAVLVSGPGQTVDIDTVRSVMSTIVLSYR